MHVEIFVWLKFNNVTRIIKLQYKNINKKSRQDRRSEYRSSFCTIGNDKISGNPRKAAIIQERTIPIDVSSFNLQYQAIKGNFLAQKIYIV